MDNTLGQATGELSPSKSVQEIIREAKRIEESTLCSAKGHFVAAEAWSLFQLKLGIPATVLVAVSGAMALTFSSSWVHVLAGSLAIAAAGLVALQTFLNPSEKHSAHLNAGNNYDAINGKVRIFWTVECWGEDSDRVLTERLRDFAEQKEKLNRACPQIPSWAYRKAMKGIEAGEGKYTVDQVDSSR